MPNFRDYLADVEILVKRNLAWDRFQGATIVVTGATGFLGKYLVHTLLAAESLHMLGLKIIIIVRDIGHARKIFANFIADSRVLLVEHDFASNKQLVINHDVNFVIHAASIASQKEYIQKQRETLLPNLTGTVDLLRLAESSHNFKGFLFLSSSEVYGECNSLNPIKEEELGRTDLFHPRSVYSESKRTGELVCRVWERSNNLPIAIARPFHTYGIGLKPGDGRAFADFINSAINELDIVITGDTETTRAYCHAIDAVEAFLRILLKPNVTGTFNVGNPMGVLTILELAELIAKLSPKSKVKIQPLGPGQMTAQSPNKILVPDISRLQGLGWSPTFSPEEGFGRILHGR